MTKKILHLIIFLCATTLGFSQTTEVIADWDNVDLTPGAAFGNGAQNGVNFPVVENPDKTGINTTDSVQMFIKATDANTWGGFTFVLPTPLDLTGGKGTVCIDVYSDHEFLLRAKIQEDANVEPKSSFDLTYDKEGTWQRLCFDMLGHDFEGVADAAGVMYTKLVLFPEYGSQPATEATFYFDNITKTTGGPFPPTLEVIADWDNVDLTPSAAFGNGAQNGVNFPVVANPDATGINTSDSVQTFIKATDANTWGGFTFVLPTPLDLTGSWGTVCIDVYSDHEFLLRAKIQEDANVEPKSSFDLTYDKEGTWQRLCFDMLGHDFEGVADAAGVMYTKLVLFPEYGSQPATEATFYFDNITKVTGSSAGTLPPDGHWISNYEPGGVTVPMSASFGNGHYGGDLFDVVANPSPGGINSTSMVQEWCKANDANTWGGWVLGLGATDTLNFTGTKATICMDVHAGAASTVRLKLEDSPNGPDLVITQDYTTPGEWQKLCFDYTGEDDNGNIGLGEIYFTMAIFPGYDVVPAADMCFHIDNIYKITDGVGNPAVFIGDIISASADHTILTQLLTTGDLWGAVNAAGVTVFAPTDAAFNALPTADLDALMNNTDNKLFDVLFHHIISSEIAMADLAMGNQYIAKNGQDATVTAANTAVDGATISDGDIAASNGVLHYTSEVMTLPDNPGTPQAKYVIMDNETDETTPSWGWTPVTIVPNPAPGGINTSATVANFIKTPGGPWWQGSLTEPNRVLNFRAGIQEVCVDVLADHPTIVKFKMEKPLTPLPDAGGAPATSISFDSDNSSVTDEWTQVCSTIAVGIFKDGAGELHELSGATHLFAKPVFFIDFIDAPLPVDTVNYFLDNFVTQQMTTSTNDLDKLENFTMFPNPTANTITINTDTPVSKAIVFNISGQRMMEIVEPLGKQINVAKLPKGIYLIGMQGADGNYIGTAKFVKE